MRLDQITGQEEALRLLRITVQACRIRRTVLPHCLLSGPPGLGKTTIATALAQEMAVPVVLTASTALHTVQDVVSLLLNLQPNTLVFIDEIHQLPIRAEEALYTAMESGVLDYRSGDKLMRIQLRPFTLVGATTRPGEMTRPMLDRFKLKVELQLYSVLALANLIRQVTRKTEYSAFMFLTDAQCGEVARVSRGTPRVAISILDSIRDHHLVTREDPNQLGMSNQDLISTLQLIGIDRQGLTAKDHRYLETLRRAARPIGINQLARLLNESIETVEQSIEPYLLRLELIDITSRGRVLR